MSKFRCFVQDDSCHWYIIPVSKKTEWEEWYDSEDAQMGITPEWAEMVNGPEQYAFVELVEINENHYVD